MLEKDAILSKISIIKNCLKTIEKATGLRPEKLDDFLIQDVFVLNVQRAVQACIDIANIIIAEKGWKLPATYAQSFQILYENGVIDKSLANIMQRMVGFRNVAVHNYQSLNLEILKAILTKHLCDFETFYAAVYHYLQTE